MKGLRLLQRPMLHSGFCRSLVGMFAILVLLSGCAIDRLLNSSEPVEGSVIDPTAVKTREGGLRVYRAAMLGFTRAFVEVAYSTAIFTDELTAVDEFTNNSPTALDSRHVTILGLPGILNDLAYNNLHVARVNAAQAITLLQKFGSRQDSLLIGESYAVQAQAIVYLAEMFCNGVPLTQVPFDGGLEYTRGLSTNELFEAAVALFDTAILYANDSIRVSEFAKIGKGRALVNLGRYDEARDIVRDVQSSYLYSLSYTNATGGVPFWKGTDHQNQTIIEIINGEGGVGMDWIATDHAMQDPRVRVTATSPHRQQKLSGASLSVSVSKGVEARMIEAEALLQPPNSPSGDWLEPINIARATVGLAALEDPGTSTARIDLLFRERAFWFYHEGHRLADYRRLVRQYNRPVLTVYPNGPYTRGAWRILAYDANYVFSPPRGEEINNHLYSGCTDLQP